MLAIDVIISFDVSHQQSMKWRASILVLIVSVSYISGGKYHY